ncbi:hypothetical protein [Sphingomonas sp. 3-13AW]|uniref:hypothetical protein n=1 Tax=Sphingomonas sp. 3-13AW TaxID=3050450 RepID=UPI003BB60561
MAKVLIVGTPNDSHVAAVRTGLALFGSTSYVWAPGDLPDYASSSVLISDDGKLEAVTVNHADESVLASDFDLLWNRRRVASRAPEFASEYDVKVIEEECSSHNEGMLYIFSMLMPAVNCPKAQRVADRKSVQLLVANSVGLKTLPTLCSNDPRSIEQFYDRFAPIVAKPYRPHGWIAGDSTLNEFTFEMPPPEQWNPKSIELCPMIFQKKVERLYEVRVIVFGDNIFGAKVVGSEGATDSRLESMLSRFSLVKEIEVPAEVRGACVAYLESMGIRYGAFDFIVDADEVWHFLECNEAGQFLFLEEFDPSMRILDAFCRWLIEVAGETVPADAPTLSFKEAIHSELGQRFVAESRSHKTVPRDVVEERVPA